MDIITGFFVALRWTLSLLPPVEVALTLGAVFFALSWIRPRRIISLPASGRRAMPLVWLGIAGALAVLEVGTAMSWLPVLDPLREQPGGWLHRPAPLLTAAAIVLIAALALRREPLPAPGERAISPRRRWWAFAPRPLLWATVGAAALLLATSAWQTLIGVPLPEGADRYGIGPENTGLPEFVQLQEGMGYFWGAGWPNHLVTLVAVLLAALALVFALGGDANRPLFARSSAAAVREERAATARVLVLITLGGLLLTLGAVWAFTGFIGDRAVGIDMPPGGGEVSTIVGSGYGDFAPLMHLGGYVVQGLGAALLLRLAVDTLRALGPLLRARGAEAPEAAAAETEDSPAAEARP